MGEVVLTSLWSMCAAACLVMAALNGMLWMQERCRLYLWSTLSASAAALNVWCEFRVFKARTIAEAARFMVIENLAVAALVISLAWFVRAYLPGARRWAVLLFTALWLLSAVNNVSSEGSLTFVEIIELEQTWVWGELYVRPIGPVNPWTHLVNGANLLFVVYVLDASWSAARGGQVRRALMVGGGTVLFMVTGTLHSMLVDRGTIESPYMVSFAFMFVIASMSMGLTDDVLRTVSAERQLKVAQAELARLARVHTISELTTTLSHELSQPLGALSLHAEAAALLLEPDASGELRAAVGAILRRDPARCGARHGVERAEPRWDHDAWDRGRRAGVHEEVG